MNKKIKQFSEQAIHDDNGETLHFLPSERYIEKFAKLIIQECIDKIDLYQIPVGNSAAGEMACKWTYDALNEIRNDIMEHFEVE